MFCPPEVIRTNCLPRHPFVWWYFERLPRNSAKGREKGKMGLWERRIL